jgi:hypothetical protein
LESLIRDAFQRSAQHLRSAKGRDTNKDTHRKAEAAR